MTVPAGAPPQSKPGRPRRRRRREKGGDLAARNSSALFRRAQELIPGGVSSPVRSFRSVGGEPFFVASARGARVRDADGNAYIDFVMSYGPHLYGHVPLFLRNALSRAIRKGTSYGAPTEAEVRLAERVRRAMPAVEMVRFVSSGTEAAMSAVRLARAATGRSRVVKTAGGYHGHADGFLVAAGSGLATLAIADSPGVPEHVAGLTSVVAHNDAGALEAMLTAHRGEVAAVLLEPLAANMGVVPPAPGYLAAVRELTRRHGVLLIFDEVISGFRVARGGAQELYGVAPDITTLGKILGGGLPVGAYGGPRDLLSQVAPAGPVYQAGTLSGNPLAMAAGIAMLSQIEAFAPYDELEEKGSQLERLVCEQVARLGLTERVAYVRVGSLSTLFFAPAPLSNFSQVKRCDTARYARFFHAMRERGIFLPPAQFEAWFLSTAHTVSDLRRTGRAVGVSLEVAFRE